MCFDFSNQNLYTEWYTVLCTPKYILLRGALLRDTYVCTFHSIVTVL